VASITDPWALREALAGAETLIHLAATPDDDDFHTQLLPNNLVGVYEVIEAARASGVRRYVLASTGQAVWWQRLRGPTPISADAPPTPRGWYACAKVFLEAVGRMVCGADGATVITVRLGWCPRTPEQAREIAASPWAQAVYLSPGDAGRFFACAAEAPLDGQHRMAFASSRPAGDPVYDLQPARQLGFVPQDTWPTGAEEMLA
jgi:nucleoside-diphosphate-sugar epimerase